VSDALAPDRADEVQLPDRVIVDRFPVGRQLANAYLAWHEEHRLGVLIDPGADADVLLARIHAMSVELRAIVLTHAHWDHVGAAEAVGIATGLPVHLHVEDAGLLRRAPLFAARVDGIAMKVPRHVAHFSGETTIELPSIDVRLIPTPGHTAGACVVRFGSSLFTGDTLLRRKAGRTDLPGGDSRALAHSLNRIRDELGTIDTIFPGHGLPWPAKDAAAWLAENAPVPGQRP
jgi:hydroxyacylglutathione hydrolase